MESKEQLKKDIIDYLVSVGIADKSLIAKALQAIKDCAFCALPADECDYDYAKNAGIDPNGLYYERITWSFAFKHYQTIAGFVLRLEEIESAKTQSATNLEDRVVDAAREGYAGDENAPCVVIVYCDRVEVKAFKTGIGSMLPTRGKKYIGTWREQVWRYPLSELSELKSLGVPVVQA